MIPELFWAVWGALFGLIGGALGNLFITMYFRSLDNEENDKSFKNSLCIFILVIFVGVFTIVFAYILPSNSTITQPTSIFFSKHSIIYFASLSTPWYNELFISFIGSLIGGVILTFALISILYEKNSRLEFEGLLRSIYEEIDHNEKQLDKFRDEIQNKVKFWCIFKNKDYARLSTKITAEERDHLDFFGWIQKKTVITSPNQRKWLYQYLSDNAYNALIGSAHSLHYQKSKLNQEKPEREDTWDRYTDLEILSRYYYSCRKFSDETQFIEDVIDEISSKIVKVTELNFTDYSDFKLFRESITIQCKKDPIHESINCVIQIEQETHSITVLRMPLYFDYLNSEERISFKNFVIMCENDLYSIFDSRGNEIKNLQDQLLPHRDRIKISKKEWIKGIS